MRTLFEAGLVSSVVSLLASCQYCGAVFCQLAATRELCSRRGKTSLCLRLFPLTGLTGLLLIRRRVCLHHVSTLVGLQVVKNSNLATTSSSATAEEVARVKSGLRNRGPPQTKVPVAAAEQGLLRGPVESALAETRNRPSLRERDRWRSLPLCSLRSLGSLTLNLIFFRGKKDEEGRKYTW